MLSVKWLALITYSMRRENVTILAAVYCFFAFTIPTCFLQLQSFTCFAIYQLHSLCVYSLQAGMLPRNCDSLLLSDGN